MNRTELTTLSPRFQALSALFTQKFFDTLPYAVAQALDASPNAMRDLEGQLQKYPTKPLLLGEPSQGTRNDSGQIFIDPNDFNVLQNNPGEMALRIIHEVGHTLDPAGTVNPNNYTDPISYANARSHGEGYSLNTENAVVNDWASPPGGNPYSTARVTLDAYNGNQDTATGMNQIRTDGVANGWSESRIQNAQVDYAANANRNSVPSTEPGSTYFKQDVRDFVMNSLGVTDPNARAAIPSLGFGTPTVVDGTSGFWNVSFSLPDGAGQYRVFTRNDDGSLTQERFSKEGVLLSTSTTAGQPFVTNQTTSSTGAVTYTVSSPAGAVLGTVTENLDGSQTTKVYGSSGAEVQTTDTYRYDDGSTMAVTSTDEGNGNFTVNSTVAHNTTTFSATKNPTTQEIELTGITSVNGQSPNASMSGITNASLAGAHISTDDLLENPGNVTPYVEAVDPTNPSGTTASPIPSSAINPSTGAIDWSFLDKFGSYGGDAVSLIMAVRSGKPIAIASAGFNVASHHITDPTVAGVAAAFSGITSLSGLKQALEKGDLGRILIDGGGVARSAITVYQNVVQYQLIEQFGSVAGARLAIDQGNTDALELIGQFDGATALLKDLGNAIAVLNIINSLAHGDIKGAFISAVAYFYPVAGAVLQVIDFLNSEFFSGNHTFEAKGHYAIQADGSLVEDIASRMPWGSNYKPNAANDSHWLQQA